MKIAIISDTHDNIPNLEKFLSWAEKNKIEKIIHCGDIASPEVVELLIKKFPLHLVFGNMDENHREAISRMAHPNLTVYGDEGKMKIEAGKKLIKSAKAAFCHLPERARELAESGRYNLVFYGHTHKPWLEDLDDCQIINPGTLGGVFSKATFAVYDTQENKLDLKILEQL